MLGVNSWEPPKFSKSNAKNMNFVPLFIVSQDKKKKRRTKNKASENKNRECFPLLHTRVS
jgi:hypothetical protein